jgi:hypothetical protein
MGTGPAAAACTVAGGGGATAAGVTGDGSCFNAIFDDVEVWRSTATTFAARNTPAADTTLSNFIFATDVFFHRVVVLKRLL